MDVRIKDLVEKTKQKFGLNNYYLQRYSIDRQLNMLNETSYLLSMEWFPNDEVDRTDEELNPDGTAVIELDLHSMRLEHSIFVGDVSYAKGIVFTLGEIDEVIKWVEEETGLLHKIDFQIDKADDHEFCFVACYKNIPVYPRASIEVKIDDTGNLTHFAKVGYFPNGELFQEEDYTLTFKSVEDIIRNQIILVEWPDYEKEQMNVMYGLEEIFIKNNQRATLSYEVVELPTSYVKVDKVMRTSPKIDTSFEEEEIEWMEEVPIEEAFANEPTPDARPISKRMVEYCQENIETFLRQVYPYDPIKWVLTILYRDRGYILGILKDHELDKCPLQRKIVVFIDCETLEVLNYIDNNLMIKAIDTFTGPEQVNSTKDTAYKKLKSHIDLMPYYVFDNEAQAYIICGKVDCHYAIDAHTDELIDTNDF